LAENYDIYISIFYVKNDKKRRPETLINKGLSGGLFWFTLHNTCYRTLRRFEIDLKTYISFPLALYI